MLMILAVVYHKKWLSMARTTAAVLLSTIIIFSVGIVLLIPLSIFFIVVSLTSKLHPMSKDASGRNAIQVFANGLIAVLCLLVYALTKNEIFILASFAPVAVSFSDTISSDIGMHFKYKTYDITTFQPIKVGLSGGISLVGTLAGIMASVAFAWLIGLIFSLDNDDKMILALAG